MAEARILTSHHCGLSLYTREATLLRCRLRLRNRPAERVVLPLHELRGERQEAHPRLELDQRIARAGHLEARQELRQTPDRRQVLERAEMQHAFPCRRRSL